MAIERVREFFKTLGREREIIEFPVSSATVALAARALGTEPGRIAKTLSFSVDGAPVLVVTSGDTIVDNRKYKAVFGCKARMLGAEDVPALVGHEVGGVCPFAVHPGVAVRLDVSLRRFDFVYPACGSANSAIKLSCDDLEALVGNARWVDVCSARDGEPSA